MTQCKPDRVGQIFGEGQRLIRRLNVSQAAPGTNTVRWDGGDDTGVAVASGVYFVRLTTSYGTVTRRITHLK
jgi:hypothetical protein